MRLLNLELKNWSCHEHLNVSLADGLQIEGRNGTGKSSILDAIRFIFSESARGYRNKIKNGTRTSTVRLEFKEDGNRYLIEKRLFLNKQSTASMLSNSTQIADNPSTVYRKMQEILSETILDKLLYVPQGGLTELIINLQRMGGRQELDSLLGLDRLEKVYEGARKELGELKVKSELRKEELRKYPENAGKEYEEEISKLEKENVNLRRDTDIKSREKERLNSEIDKLREKIEVMQKTKRKIEEHEKNLNQVKLQIAENGKELEGVNQKLEDIKKRRDELILLEADEEKLRKYMAIKKLLSELESKKEKLRGIGDLEEMKEKLRRGREEITRGDDIQKRYDEEMNKVIEMEREVAAKREKLREVEEYLEKLMSLEGEARCPRCGQRLTKEHIETENNIANNEISKLKEELGSLGGKLNERKMRVKKQAHELEAWRKKKMEIEHLEKDLEEKHREQRDLQSSIQDITVDLRSSGYGGETADIVDDKISHLNRIQERITLYREEIRREREYSQRKEEIGKKLSRANERKEKIEGKLSRMEYDEEEHSALEKEKDVVREKFYTVKSAIENIGFQVQKNENRIRELKEKIEDYINLKNKCDEIDREINLLREARDIFHTNKGIVKYLRERYIMQLSSLLTYYFKRINQNPIYRDISFDKDYNIKIKALEGEFGIDQLSGGEKVQLALALRIALINMLSPTRLLILDEPFGSLDEEHREVLGEALNRIAGDGQLILVTHIAVDSLNLPHKLSLGGY